MPTPDEVYEQVLAEETAKGSSTGQSIERMEALATRLPSSFNAEWTGIAFEQKAAGNVAALVFAPKHGIAAARAKVRAAAAGVGEAG